MVERVLKLLSDPLRLRLIELLADGGERAGAGRNAVKAFAIRVISAALVFLSQVALARLMGTFEFGIFTTAWVWVTVLGTLSSLGFATSAVRFIPEYREHNKLDLFRGFLAAGRTLAAFGGTLAMAGGLLMVGFWPGLVQPYYVLPLALALLSLPAYAVTDFQDGVGRAMGWIDLALGPPYILRPLLLLVAIAVGFAAGLPQSAAVATGCLIVATILTAAGQYAAQHNRLGAQLASGPHSFAVPVWIRLSLPLLLIDGFTLLMLSLDVLLLNLFETPDQVGVYFAAARTISLVAFIPFAVGAVAMPRFSKLRASGRERELGGALKEMQLWSILPSLAAAGAILLLGKPLLGLFGQEFTQAYPLMFVLAVGLLLRALAGPAQNLLLITGQQNLTARILLVAVAINAGLNLALIPRFGPMGAAVATATAFAFEALTMRAVARRLLGNGARWGGDRQGKKS